MKFISPARVYISLTWLVLSVFFMHQLPGLTQENQQNNSINPAVTKVNNQSVDNINVEELRNALRQNKIYPQSLPQASLEKQMYSMESKFTVFPEDATIDLTLRDIDLPSVLRILAKEGQKNIIIDKSVQGTVSAELKNVSLNEAMQTILTSEELEARINGDTIYVASRPAMALKGLNRKYIKAFKLNNANAVDVAKLLEASIFNKGYKLKSGSSSSSAPSGMAHSGMSMQAIASPESYSNSSPNSAQSYPSSYGQQSGNNYVNNDNSARQAPVSQSTLLETKTIRGKVEKLNPGDGFSDASKLASEIKLQNITSTIDKIDVSNNDNGAIVIPDTRTNSLLIAGLQEDIALAGTAIKYLDKPLPQVSIDVSLLEIDKTDTNNLGLNASAVAGKWTVGFTPNATGSSTPGSLTYNTVKTISDNLSATITALIQHNKAKLLANPNVLALDGSESLIKITNQIVSKMTVTSQAQTGSIMYDPTLADVGIVLNILPKISEDGYVTMRLRPSITTALAQVSVDTQGEFVTPISTREVLMQDVRVKSGQTFAIAGLLNDSETDSIGKLPYISDVPILGKLFTNTSKIHTKTELIILITPKIISEASTN